MSLEIKNLHLSYNKKKHALHNLSLTSHVGVLGLLGPNGAGKSSLMRILATLKQPTSGEVLWQGTNTCDHPQMLRQQLGYLPQYFGVYEQLTAKEFLHYLAGLKGLEHQDAETRIDALLNQFNLSHVANSPLASFSGGMRQRIGIAQALLNSPKLLIVDEPTVGLDPHERLVFRQLIADISKDSLVILSTHIVSDIETIADSIAIMNQGQLITHNTPEQLIDKVAPYCFELTVPREEAKALQAHLQISHSVRQGDNMTLHFVSAKGVPKSAVARKATLEDAYLYFVNSRHITESAPITDTTVEVA
ncbi:MAG: ABC transporter ATP-binding protein [Psychrobium sp.]